MEVTYLSDDVFYIENFLSPDECREYIELSEELGYGEAAIDFYGEQKIVKEIRNNERVLHDSVELAKTIWRKIKDYLPEQQDGLRLHFLNERFRFYRYDPKQIFRWHRDGSFKRNNEESRLTLLIYLNEGFDGGETDFREFKVSAKTGRAVIFKHELLHEGSELRAGRKYVMRTDVMYMK